MGFAAGILHVLDPAHALAVQLILIVHHAAVIGWQATHDSQWLAPSQVRGEDKSASSSLNCFYDC